MPGAVTFGPDGTLYVADTAAQRIRAISNGGYVRTVAGSGDIAPSGLWVEGGFRDGPALQSHFFGPSGLAVDRDGSIYAADTFNHCIRLLRGGIVSTVGGQCGTAGSADGPAGSSLMKYRARDRMEKAWREAKQQYTVTFNELRDAQSQVAELRERDEFYLTEMRQSKFWRARNAWFRVKRAFGIATDMP